MEMRWETLRAHTASADGRQDLLNEHLKAVAARAREFCAAFGAGETGFLLGLLHDLGKANPAFQDYLSRLEAGEKLQQGPPHSVWGAALAYWLLRVRCADMESWKEFALPVAGHHGALSSSSDVGLRLSEFINTHPSEIRQLQQILRDRSFFPACFAIPDLRGPGDRELFIRMLFSSLVDADFLVSERHFDSRKAERREAWPDLHDLWLGFGQKQTALLDEHSHDTGKVNPVRREVYEACLKAAQLPPGLFRLTVPTGGGKTRSGLGFALAHALAHQFQRIVVALPYTSIIDQTVKVFREVLGDGAVIEHHSQLPTSESEAQDELSVRRRLATENWEAPVIVTTTVQLFESLLGNRTSKLRKLHNLARSVMVLDEAQCLPVELLKTSVAVLQTLVREYHVSVVFCTATQPAVDQTPYLSGFEGMPIREIVPQYSAHFQALVRVKYEVRETPVSTEQLAAEILDLEQVLVILNTRKDAIDLLGALRDPSDVFHLSTLLCGAHRRAVLEEIKLRLKQGLRVRLISTQVVEAGVDLDFPVVYRAIAPLDRIVQAAGRCNREGRLSGLGRVVLFQPEAGGMPRGTYQAGFEQAKLLLGRYPAERLHEPELYQEYFQRLYSYVDTDKRAIEPDRLDLNYPEVARKYRLIADDTVAAVVQYGDSAARLADWEKWPSRQSWRALQPFLVNLFRFEASRFEGEGWLQQLADELYYWLGRYDVVLGIQAANRDPADLYVDEQQGGRS